MGKIGFYCSSISWGGLEMNFVRYAIWLAERGYAIIVYCVQGSPIADKLKNSSLKVTYVKRNRKYFDIINAFRVYKLIKRDRIQAFWIRDTRDMSTIGIAKTITSNKVKIIYQQAMQITFNKKDIFHTVRFSKIDLWITPLQYLASQVKSFTRFKKERIKVIPLATEIDPEQSIMTKAKARDILELPEDKFIIGVIGRIDPLKGQHFLIKALANLRNQDLNIDLLIVGDTTKHEGNEYQNFIKQEVKDMGIEENVHFRPFLDNVEIFFRAVDLFIMASKGETFGMVTIEAMTYGTPLLGTNSAGTPEILETGELGFLYEVDDENNFCKKVKWILNNEEKVNEKREAALKVAQHKYSRKEVLDQIENSLSSLNLIDCKTIT